MMIRIKSITKLWTGEYQNIIDTSKIQYTTQIWLKRIYQVTDNDWWL